MGPSCGLHGGSAVTRHPPCVTCVTGPGQAGDGHQGWHRVAGVWSVTGHGGSTDLALRNQQCATRRLAELKLKRKKKSSARNQKMISPWDTSQGRKQARGRASMRRRPLREAGGQAPGSPICKNRRSWPWREASWVLTKHTC